MQSYRHSSVSSRLGRTGAATLDYILVLGVVFPLAAIVIPTGRRMIALAYEMVCVFVAWPFM